MLYKNDELFKITDEIIEKVKSAVGKFPVTIKMPDFFYTQSKGNDKPDRPAMAVVALTAQTNSATEGSVKWNYCTRRKGTKEQPVYIYTGQGRESNALEFVDSMTVSEGEIDLLYFLLYISPLRYIPGESDREKADRGVRPNQRFMFVIENKNKEAAKKIATRQTRLKVENAIMKDLKMEDLKKVASAMGCSNVDIKEELELRDELMNIVEFTEKATKDGYEKFTIAAKLDMVTEVKGTIQKALDYNVIAFNEKNDVVVYLKQNGHKGRTITGPIGPRNLRESLEFFLESNPDQVDEMKIAVDEASMATA